MQNSYFINLS